MAAIFLVAIALVALLFVMDRFIPDPLRSAIMLQCEHRNV
jgi:hypothetical protein